ncbi:MAG: DUF2142 domain-containing protein [Oscillospiraceae bacterium]|nr:DUF2142 domain-containing protein [Oscillospiraceae bacterium]
MMKKCMTRFTSKIHKKHLLMLFMLFIPVWLIGISNYFFAYSSYHLLPSLEDADIMTRQWVGSKDGIMMTIAISAVVAILWVISLYTGSMDRLISYISGKILSIKKNPNKILVHIIILMAIVFAAFVIEALTSSNTKVGLVGAVRVMFYATIGFSIYLIVIFRKSPEKIFLSLYLIIGFVYIAAHPPAWYGFDNEIHYAWALEESYIRTVSVADMDIELTRPTARVVFGSLLPPEGSGFRELIFDKESTTVTFFRKGTDSLIWTGHDESRDLFNRLAHIPSGLMLFIGRSLSLAPLLIFKLGMLGNHLVFTAIIYFAIRRLSSGKHIMAVIAMFPTTMMLATTYGYDYWVIGLAMLGAAYCFYEMQNPDKKIELKSLIIMIASFTIAMGPKAIYFPLMCIMYLISKEKFETKKGYNCYLLTVSCAILFVIASFLIPIMVSSGGEGDFRGGSEVDPSGQMAFIFNNPLTYSGILLSYISHYFNIFIVQNYVTFFANLGSSSYYHLIWALVAFVTITDRNTKDRLTSTIGLKAIVAVIIVSTIALFSTALYIAFTGVGAHHIAGLQGRYILPALFPLLYVIGSFRIENLMDKSLYSTAVFGVMSFVLLYGAWEMLIQPLSML